MSNELNDELEELMAKALDEYFAQTCTPRYVPTHALTEKWPGVDWPSLVIAHIEADPRSRSAK